MTTVENFNASVGGAFSRARAWMDERKERKADARARRIRERGHDSRFWLLSIPATATLCAAFVEVYWAVLFCIQATGRLDNDWAVSFGTAQAASGAWHFTFDIRSVPVLIGLVAATVPIVMWSMVWLPVQMKARGTGRWRRTTMICAGLLANALVIVSGTVVMNSNRQEQVRAGLVTEQTADAQRGVLAAHVQDLRDELSSLTNNRSTYVSTAASVGAAAYEHDYVVQARATHDVRLPLLERALGAAHRADELKREISAARVTVATAAPAAASAVHVEDHAGVGLDTFATYANVYRPPFVALICTTIGIFGTWWWVGLAEAMSQHNVSLSGWAREDQRIEDLRHEASIIAEPMKPHREELRDADTKEIIVDKDGDVAVKVKEHLRKKKGKDGQPVKIMVQPPIPPNESGTPEGLDHGDGGLRSAALHSPANGEHEPLVPEEARVDVPSEAAQQPEPEQRPEEAADTQDEPSEDEAAALLAASEESNETLAVDTPPAPLAVEESLPEDDGGASEPDAPASDSHDDPLDQGIAAVFARPMAATLKPIRAG